jgi:F-type H+-transporting ATPase subunit b
MDFGFLSKIGFDLEVAIANLVNFLLIFIVFKLFFYKPIMKTLEERKVKIAKGLRDAEEAVRQLEEAEAARKEILVEAKKDADSIRAEAQEYAHSMKETTVLETKDIALQMKQDARKDIEQERVKMEQEAESKMTSLVAALTEKAVVKK